MWSAAWRLQRRVASRWTHAHKHTHTVRWPHFDCWKLTLGLTVVETMQCALQFRDSLVQSQHSLKAKPRPLLLPHENLELSGAESIMGAPEATACQVAERGRKCLSFLMFSLLSSSFLLHLSLLFSLHPFAALSSSLHVSLPVQSFLSAVSQLCHTCSSRIDWLEQEVSAHRSHVTALRSELQDACLRDNLAFVPVRLPLL